MSVWGARLDQPFVQQFPAPCVVAQREAPKWISGARVMCVLRYPVASQGLVPRRPHPRGARILGAPTSLLSLPHASVRLRAPGDSLRVKWGCFLRGAFVLSPRVGMLGVEGSHKDA